MLYTHFEVLRAYLNDNSLFSHLLQVLNQQFDNLPEDQEQSIYYLLGCCSSFHKEITKILSQLDITEMLSTPERTFNHASEYSLSLQEKNLKTKIKSASSLSEARNLRQQYNEIIKRIGLKLKNQ